MTNHVKNVEVGDVLSSIRRLVSDELRGGARPQTDAAEASDRLILTPQHRVAEAPDEAAGGPSVASAATRPGWLDRGLAGHEAARPGSGGSPETDDEAAHRAALARLVQSEVAAALGRMSSTQDPAAAMPETRENDGPAAIEAETRSEEADAAASAPVSSRRYDRAAAVARRKSLEDKIAELEAMIGRAPRGEDPAEVEDQTTETPAESRVVALDAARRAIDAGADFPADETDHASEVEDAIAEIGAEAGETAEAEDPDEAEDLRPWLSDAADPEPAPDADASPSEGDDGYAAVPVEFARSEGRRESSAPEPRADGVPATTSMEDPASTEAEPAGIFNTARTGPARLRESAPLDPVMLREMVAQIVREELQGTLGERITRNVRKLVRSEVQRALTIQDFD